MYESKKADDRVAVRSMVARIEQCEVSLRRTRYFVERLAYGITRCEVSNNTDAERENARVQITLKKASTRSKASKLLEVFCRRRASPLRSQNYSAKMNSGSFLESSVCLQISTLRLHAKVLLAPLIITNMAIA